MLGWVALHSYSLFLVHHPIVSRVVPQDLEDHSWIMMLGVLAVVLAVVFFKLGVYSVLLGLFELLAKVLFFGTGLFLLVYGARWLLQRRRAQPVRWGR